MLRRVLGIGLASLAVLTAHVSPSAAADEAADEQKAIEAIRNSGGTIQVDEADPAKPAVGVHLNGAQVTDDALAHIRRLTKLRKLYLTNTTITDAGLAPLEDLLRLEVLDLAGTKITDAGLAHLEDLPRLRVLDLSYTGVTAAGLEHLKKLNSLQELYLIGLKPPDLRVVGASTTGLLAFPISPGPFFAAPAFFPGTAKAPDKPEEDPAAEFEKKVLDFLKAQPQVKVVR